MAAQPCNTSNSERLKVQGNELYLKGQHQAAHRKYTEAIKEDPSNAIYYANRAACSLAMKEYMDAGADAQKSVDIDPKYAKGWSRLASASHELSRYSQSVDAWTTALQCLPPAGASSATEKTLRTQFEAGLAKARRAQDAQDNLLHSINVGPETKLPWHMAEAMEADLVAAKKISSAFVILTAYREYKEGVDAMKKLTRAPVNGTMQIVGKAGALVDITNGVMRDPRVFHIDSPDWIDKFNQQVMFEAQVYNAWVNGGAKTIQEEAPKLLQKKGWDQLRPALGTTIRAWLMCGFMAISTQRFVAAMEYYSRITDVLEWGSRKWANVNVLERGVIFEKSFIRGINRMKISAMNTCVAAKASVPSLNSSEMVKLAHHIIDDAEENPPVVADGESLDPGFIASFWIYPRAEALSVLGRHYMQIGLNEKNPKKAQEAFVQSADYYLGAANSFPSDDENVLVFLKVALEAYWFMPEGKRLLDMIPVIAQISEAIPDVMKIWENAASHEPRDAQIKQALAFAERCTEALDAGKITVESLVRPKELEKTCKWKDNSIVYI